MAATAGAAQLGLGYGLGIFTWVPTVRGTDDVSWLASLVWTGWIAATAVILGAVVAERSERRAAVGPMASAGGAHHIVLVRLALVFAATLGGLVVAGLTALPARVAERADTFAPQLLVGAYAIAGALLGLVAALAAVHIRAIAANVIATTGWMWLLATVTVLDGFVAGDAATGLTQLGVWRVTTDGPWFYHLYLPGALMIAASSLLIGAFAAWPAARAGAGRTGVALSGAAGPALIAAAYLLAVPRLVPEHPEQLSAHLIAPYAVLTGLIGSVLVALLGYGKRPSSPSAAVGAASVPTARAHDDKSSALGTPNA